MSRSQDERRRRSTSGEDAYNPRQRERSRAKDAARDRALAAKGKVTTAQDSLAAHKAKTKQNTQAIRSSAAQGLAAGAPTGLMAAGGGFLGAANQAGMDANMQGIRQASADAATERDISANIAQMAMDEAGARMEAAEYASTAGTAEEDYIKAMGDAETEMSDFATANSSWINDDETAMNNKAQTIYARLKMSSPKAAQEFHDKWIASGGEGKRNVIGYDFSGWLGNLV